MNIELRRKWIEALRSGQYTQGFGRLQTEDGKFCCLGVLCDVSGVGHWDFRLGYPVYLASEKDSGKVLLPEAIRAMIGISKEQELKLARLNDVKPQSFSEIADYIEKEL